MELLKLIQIGCSFFMNLKNKDTVGELLYNNEKEVYELIYDRKYANSKNSYPFGA